MRLIVLIPVALVLGIVCGGAIAFWEYGPTAASAAAAAATTTPSDDAPQPVAEAVDPIYSFGNIELGGSQNHSFSIKNTGKATLKLDKGPTSCKCTTFQLEDTSIPPGSSGTVILEFRGEGEIGPYRKTAEVLTNDPKHPKITLSLQGELTEAVRVEPAELVLSSVPAREPTTGHVRIYAVNSDNLQITSSSFESDEGSKQFDVTFEPLPEEELEAHKAKSGVLATVTSKPPLPLGPIRQKISLESNLATKPKMQFTITGLAVSDVSIMGPDWNNENGVLRLGAIKRNEGRSRTLRLVTRGPMRKDIEFKVASKSPEFLEVSFGKMIEVNQGAVTQVPITIAVPRSAPEANHLGSAVGKMGEVVLETNHPDAKEVKLRVQFVVEE